MVHFNNLSLGINSKLDSYPSHFKLNKLFLVLLCSTRAETFHAHRELNANRLQMASFQETMKYGMRDQREMMRDFLAEFREARREASR